MDKKVLSIISYITIVGWVVAFVLYSNETIKPSLVRFHLKQALGLGIFGLISAIAASIIVPIVPAISLVFYALNIAIFIFWILGIINAANEKEKPLPLIGDFFVDKFDFIK